MRRAIRFAAAALPLVLWMGIWTGCSEPTSGPVAGTLEVVLTTPFPDDGGLLLTVTGGRVDSLEADGLTVYTSRPNPTALQIILLGDIGSGTVARLHIADQRLAGQYSAALNQVAARATYVQRDPAAYQLSLTP